MNNTNKEHRQPTIRVNVLKHGCWAHNNKCGVLANTKNEAIAEIKKQFPGEYLVIDIAAEHVRSSNVVKDFYSLPKDPKPSIEDPSENVVELSSEEKMEIAAHMSKL